MLKSLYIKNFTLIDESLFSPQEGLNIITGETGAGKTILLDALGLTLGHRADPKTVGQNGKAVIEATYEIGKLGLQDFFVAQDLDYETETKIRREITAEGKSRAFVNDTPTTLAVLKELGDFLIEIHTQNSTYDFKSSANKLEIVDNYGQTRELLADYVLEFENLRKKENELKQLEKEKIDLAKDQDYNDFLLQEFIELNLNIEKDREIEIEIDTLSHAEEISAVAGQTAYAMQGDENALLSGLQNIKANLRSFININPSISQVYERIESSAIELNDLAQSLQKIADDTEANPAQLEELNERYNKIKSLLRKHAVNEFEDLVSIQAKLEEKSFTSQNIDQSIQKVKADIEELHKKASRIAGELNKKRVVAAKELSKAVEEELKRLEIKDAQFNIDISFDSKNLLANGGDTVKFLFSANAGRAVTDIEKSASGGELSRVFFCIKSLLANKVQLPTLIFDEADTGVSGEVAQRMGLLMEDIGKKHQVIAITHLPQVASKGQNHFHVSKTSDKNKSISAINSQTPAQRVQILAEMMQGKNPDEAAQKAAANLLGSR